MQGRRTDPPQEGRDDETLCTATPASAEVETAAAAERARRGVTRDTCLLFRAVQASEFAAVMSVVQPAPAPVYVYPPPY